MPFDSILRTQVNSKRSLSIPAKKSLRFGRPMSPLLPPTTPVPHQTSLLISKLSSRVVASVTLLGHQERCLLVCIYLRLLDVFQQSIVFGELFSGLELCVCRQEGHRTVHPFEACCFNWPKHDSQKAWPHAFNIRGTTSSG